MSPSPQALALRDWHLQRGGRLGEVRGSELCLGYGDSAGELDAAREGCALHDASDAPLLELVGEDAQRFLNGLVTCNVASLSAGEGCYGFFTSPKGHVLADVVILHLEDRYRLRLPTGLGGVIRDHLERYIVADRVSVEILTDPVAISLIGPDARRLAGLTEEPVEPWRHARATLLSVELRWMREGYVGAEAWTLWVPKAKAAAFLDELVGAGAVPVGLETLEHLRIEAGLPRWGLDFGPDNLPQETGLEEAVCYEKGCYLGQEVVARLHYRGQAPRRLCRLTFEAGVVPEPGASLLFEEREAGRLTSVTRSRPSGVAVGLAILQRRAAAPGTRLRLAEGVEAEVGAPRPAPLSD